MPLSQKAIHQEKFITSESSQISSESFERPKDSDFSAHMMITWPNSSAIYAGESKGPIKGYEEKLDRPEPTMDASRYWSDVHQQLVTGERHKGPEKATVKSLNSVAHYF